MRKIDIQGSTYERLQRHGKPFEDTPDAVINRALDALEASAQTAEVPVSEGTERVFGPADLPEVMHAPVTSAVLDGRRIPSPNWQVLTREMLVLASGRTTGREALRKMWRLNSVEGCRTDSGYTHLPGVGLSLQATGADTAARALVEAARFLGIGLEIHFRWRNKKGAAHPGERGCLRVPPTGTTAR